VHVKKNWRAIRHYRQGLKEQRSSLTSMKNKYINHIWHDDQWVYAKCALKFAYCEPMRFVKGLSSPSC
jgi:hypothetical protein